MSGPEKLRCPATCSDDAMEWAEVNGLNVVFPTENQLLIDLDNHHNRETFAKNRDIIDQTWGIQSTMENMSRGGNLHMTVTLNRNVTQIERIALQAVLGSDLRREAHSLRRWLEGEEHPTLFFEKP